MTPSPTRRTFLFGSLSLLGACAGSPAPVPPTTPNTPKEAERDLEKTLREIEKSIGGRLGVFALDTGTKEELAHRADERFALCSTFKWVLAAQVLAEVERGALSLDERVAYGPGDLLEHAPITTERVGDGAMTVEALAAASVTFSDNTAANLLLRKLGGPEGLTRFARSFGDTVTRLDRTEPTMNENAPGDERDTTSPRAMVALLRDVLLEPAALSASSRERLLGWMRDSTTGKNRLRAGLPPDWRVEDKTGTGQRNAVNDVGILTPPNRAPILVAVYTSDGTASFQRLEAALAEVAKVVARES